jgi:hypothetical protein
MNKLYSTSTCVARASGALLANYLSEPTSSVDENETCFVQCTFSVRSNSYRYELPLMIIMPFCRPARELNGFDDILEVLEYVLCGPCLSVWLGVT